MRELRENVRSVLSSGGGGAKHDSGAFALSSPVTPAPARRLLDLSTPAGRGGGGYAWPTPATPVPPAAPAWATPAGTWQGQGQGQGPSVSWATPPERVDADLRVAELTAGLVAATDVERRQSETIRRLATQLERAERLEEGRVGRRSEEEDVRERVRSSGGGGARVRADERGSERRRGEDARSFERDLEEEDAYRSSRARGTPRSAGTSARKRGIGLKEKVRVSARREDDRIIRRDEGDDDDAEFRALRRKVHALEKHGGLAEQNAELRVERAEARKEAECLSTALGEIRESATSMLRDREELVATIAQLRKTMLESAAEAAKTPVVKENVRAEYGGSGHREGEQVRSCGNRGEHSCCGGWSDCASSSRRSGGNGLRPPTDAQFNGYGTPSAARKPLFPANSDDRSDEDVCQPINEEDSSSLEDELRAELHAVIKENSALSDRVIELENMQQAYEAREEAREAARKSAKAEAQAQQAAAVESAVQAQGNGEARNLDHAPQVAEGDRSRQASPSPLASVYTPPAQFSLFDDEALDELRAEIMVLASVAECMRFGSTSGENTMQGQATLTVLDTFGPAHRVLQDMEISGMPMVMASASSDGVQQLSEKVACIRQSIALKYGEWLAWNNSMTQRTAGLSTFGEGDELSSNSSAPPSTLQEPCK